MHTHTHACTPTHMCTWKHTHVHPQPYRSMCVYTPIHTQSGQHMHVHPHTGAHMYAHTPPHTRKHIHVHTHRPRSTCMHTPTHEHIRVETTPSTHTRSARSTPRPHPTETRRVGGGGREPRSRAAPDAGVTGFLRPAEPPRQPLPNLQQVFPALPPLTSPCAGGSAPAAAPCPARPPVAAGRGGRGRLPTPPAWCAGGRGRGWGQPLCARVPKGRGREGRGRGSVSGRQQLLARGAAVSRKALPGSRLRPAPMRRAPGRSHRPRARAVLARLRHGAARRGSRETREGGGGGVKWERYERLEAVLLAASA